MLIIKQPVQLDEENVDHGYALTTDEYNIILYKLGIYLKGKNQGEISKTPVGYFSTLEHVLQRIYSLEVGLVGFEDLQALHGSVSSTIDRCVESLGKLNYIRGSLGEK